MCGSWDSILRFIDGLGRTLWWAVVAATFLGAAGAVIGVCYGAALTILDGDPSAFTPAFVRCLLSGAGAGAMLGAFINLCDGCNPLSGADPDEAAALRQGAARLGRGTIPTGLRVRLYDWPLRGSAGVASDDPLLIRTTGMAAVLCSPVSLRPGDLVEVTAGGVVPADGEIVSGTALVDESEISGQSCCVIREAGDCGRVLRGSHVIRGEIRVRVLGRPG